MKNEPDRKTILFDLDGTLLDQTETILKSHNYVQDHFGFPQISYEEFMSTLGIDLPLALEQFLKPELVEEACVLFKKHYDLLSQTEELKLIDGTEWILENLTQNGYKLAMFTNKPGIYARKIAKDTKIDHHFLDIIARHDTPYFKPQPEFTHHALKTIKACPKSAILIGDSIYDVEAGASVGLPVYTVTTGGHSREFLLNHHIQPTGIFDNLYEAGHHLFGFPLPVTTAS